MLYFNHFYTFVSIKMFFDSDIYNLKCIISSVDEINVVERKISTNWGYY